MRFVSTSSVCPTGIQPRLSGIAPGISRLKMRDNLLLKEKAWDVPCYDAFPLRGRCPEGADEV